MAGTPERWGRNQRLRRAAEHLEELAAEAEQEGEQQRADVGAVHVSVRQDDDLRRRPLPPRSPLSAPPGRPMLPRRPPTYDPTGNRTISSHQSLHDVL